MRPNFLKMWNIFKNKNTNKRIIYYGSYDKFLDDECEDKEERDLWDIVQFCDWTVDELTEIFGNDIEDTNYHSWTWLPSELLRILRNCRVSDEHCFEIILNTYKRWICGY